jgi:branched-chain amino acid transport system permease protein
MTDFLNAFVLLANFVIIPAVAYGAQLALGALGVTLIYSVLRFANFAHGDMMAFGTMVAILFMWLLQGWGISIAPLPTALLALPVGILGPALLALGTDRMVYRFYRRQRSAPVVFVMVSVGVMFIYNALTRFLIGVDDQRIEDGERFLFTVAQFREFTGLEQGLALRTSQVITVVVMVIVTTAVFWFLQKTRTGKAMRAYSDNEDLALLSGINPDRVVRITWLLAAALATIAGVLYGLDKSFRPFTYFQILLPIFAAAIVGGIGQPFGAIAGGFIIAFAETAFTYAYRGVPRLYPAGRHGAGGPRAAALHRLQVRGLLHHPGDRAAGATDRHLPREGAVMGDQAPRILLLYGVMLLLVIIVGVFQSWTVALAIANLALISAIMALGVNIQWGYAGLFNVGIMGFAALGGVAACSSPCRPSRAPGRREGSISG